MVQPGNVINMPNVPHAFLREAPLIDGDWIDQYVVELAELGLRLVEQGYRLEDPEDQHPMAWQRATDPEDSSEADAAVTIKLWQHTKKHIAGFPGRTKVVDERQYLSFQDYMKWKGRRSRGDLKRRMGTGLVVSAWSDWVEAQGSEGVASLAGVEVSKLSCYLDGYRYRVCIPASELADEVSRRKSLLESLQVGKPGNDDEERFRRRVEHWKESALGFLPEIYTVRGAINSISQRYFDGREGLFPDVAKGFDQLVVSAEKLVGIYNEALAEDIERLGRLLIETGGDQDESPLTIDVAGPIESVQGVAKEQVAYMVDMAKADALDLLGESRQAFELVDRHVRRARTMIKQCPSCHTANQPGAVLEPDRVLGYNVRMSQALSNDGGFVGRRGEMAELKAALDDAMAGHGRLVMLVGEPASERLGWPKSRPPSPRSVEPKCCGAAVAKKRAHLLSGLGYNPFDLMSKSEAARGCIRRWAPAPLTSQRSSPKYTAS